MKRIVLSRRIAIGWMMGAVLAGAIAAHALRPAPLAPHKGAKDVTTTHTTRKHLLVVTVTKGFRHDSIPVAEKTIAALGDSTGAWDTDFVRTDDEMQAKMTPAGLSKYDGVVFANTTGVLPLPDPQGFLDWIKAGHGFAAIHSGSDTFHEWPGQKAETVSAYIEMLGGEFLTHHNQTAIAAKIEDPTHPATRSLVTAGRALTSVTAANFDLGQKTFPTAHTWHVYDEIYLLKNNPRGGVHVLLSLDTNPDDGSPEAGKPGEHLVSWTKRYGRGRVFYTILGHRQEVWHDVFFQEHLAGGLKYALGVVKGADKPAAAP